MLESITFRQFSIDTQLSPGQQERRSTGSQPSTKPAQPTPKTIFGYFPTKRDMQLARAESLAG